MRLFRWLPFLAVLAGCRAEGPLAPTPGLDLAALRAVPERVVVGAKELTLTTHLWRDFMPITPPGGRPLAAVLNVATADSTPFPATVRADRAWVLFGDRVWEASVAELLPPDPTSPTLVLVARDGPKWGPGVYVDVVVRLEDDAGRSYLLQARKQYVGRTD